MLSEKDKEIIKKITEETGCDRDGDIVLYNGKKYYVDLFSNIIKQV